MSTLYCEALSGTIWLVCDLSMNVGRIRSNYSPNAFYLESIYFLHFILGKQAGLFRGHT